LWIGLGFLKDMWNVVVGFCICSGILYLFFNIISVDIRLVLKVFICLYGGLLIRSCWVVMIVVVVMIEVLNVLEWFIMLVLSGVKRFLWLVSVVIG